MDTSDLTIYVGPRYNDYNTTGYSCLVKVGMLKKNKNDDDDLTKKKICAYKGRINKIICAYVCVFT